MINKIHLIKNYIKKNIDKTTIELSKNHIKFTNEQLDELKQIIINHYQSNANPDNNSELSLFFKQDLEDHLINRLKINRKYIIPWINSIKPLNGANILEIGCGTGSSTLAFAEQGAFVTGIDIHENSLIVAKERLRIANLNTSFYAINATEIKKHFIDKDFDFIIFYASLEHMTIEERIKSLKDTWEILKPNSYLVVIEAPNRLWYIDEHSSSLPFFNWLPDELAILYSKYSERNNFKELFNEINDEKMNEFKRMGRGVSYHEFEIAIDTLDKLNVQGRLDNIDLDYLNYPKKDIKYMKFLKDIKNDIPNGLLHPIIDIAIKKE